jgi:hypothetical protein
MRKPLILPLTEAWPSENCEILEPWNYISLKSASIDNQPPECTPKLYSKVC